MPVIYDVLVTAPHDRGGDANKVVQKLRDLGLNVCHTRGRALSPHNWQENVRVWSRQSRLRIALAPPEGHDRPHSQNGWRREDQEIYEAFASWSHSLVYTTDVDWIVGYILGMLDEECKSRYYMC